MNLKDAFSVEKSNDQPRQHIKKLRHYFANKGLCSQSYDKPRQYITKQIHHFAEKGLYNQSYGFSSSHVPMWELDRKEGWAPKKWCFRIVVLNKTLQSPVDWKEIKLVNSKGNQPWMFLGRTDAEVPILWQPDAKSWLIEKDPEAGKDWRQKEKRAAKDEMVR